MTFSSMTLKFRTIFGAGDAFEMAGPRERVFHGRCAAKIQIPWMREFRERGGLKHFLYFKCK